MVQKLWNIKNEDSLNEILSARTDKFCCNKQNKKNSNIMKYFRKIRIGSVFYICNKHEFSFPSHCLFTNDPDKLFSQFISFIVHSEVSRFFTNSRFLEKFYKDYAKIYYLKMASTIRNYTVESISLKSTIFPFEAAFTDFINHYNDFENVINEITSDVLYLCTKRFIDFNYYNDKIDDCKDCYIS